MITDDDKELAVDILRPGNKAEAAALYWKMKAEQHAEKVKARAYLTATGTVEERKALSILNEDYQSAWDDFCTKSGAHHQAKHDIQGAKYLLEVWEQEGHNARALVKL